MPLHKYFYKKNGTNKKSPLTVDYLATFNCDFLENEWNEVVVEKENK